MEIPEEIRNLKFEEARAQLEELVEKMESGNMPLEELISCRTGPGVDGLPPLPQAAGLQQQ